MTDSEKIMMFSKFMRDKKYSEEKVKYNLHVVNLLVSQVLFIFEQSLENIDTYCFEEFTDMVVLIDEELGGRDGIPKILEAMQELTEFLKVNKLIKGGKIAHYKRMFTDVKHYLDKYDMMTGRKDDTKEYIKSLLSDNFGFNVIKLVEDVNVYGFKTLDKIDKLLNDIPLSKRELEDASIIKALLIDLNLLEEKGGQIDTTKKGRAISRLTAEERYGAIASLLFYRANWDSVFMLKPMEQAIGFREILHIISSIFYKQKEVSISIDDFKKLNEEDILIEISKERFRIAKVEAHPFGYKIMDICFVGMGLLNIKSSDRGEVIYSATPLGENIFKVIFNQVSWFMRQELEGIKYLIKNKNYDEAEIDLLKFISTYGGNIVVWDYLGQLLLLKKSYKFAYSVLKYGYENSSKRGRAAKSALYHLVLCCRSLKLKDDVENYEKLLQKIEKV